MAASSPITSNAVVVGSGTAAIWSPWGPWGVAEPETVVKSSMGRPAASKMSIPVPMPPATARRPIRIARLRLPFAVTDYITHNITRPDIAAARKLGSSD